MCLLHTIPSGTVSTQSHPVDFNAYAPPNKTTYLGVQYIDLQRKRCKISVEGWLVWKIMAPITPVCCINVREVAEYVAIDRFGCELSILGSSA